MLNCLTTMKQGHSLKKWSVPLQTYLPKLPPAPVDAMIQRPTYLYNKIVYLLTISPVCSTPVIRVSSNAHLNTVIWLDHKPYTSATTLTESHHYTDPVRCFARIVSIMMKRGIWIRYNLVKNLLPEVVRNLGILCVYL